jgi:hypothetical protein
MEEADVHRVALTEPPFRAINCDLDNQLSLADCLFSGRLAGRGAAARSAATPG